MILVAGGTGRLGSQVVRGLLARGHEVRVLARGEAPGGVDSVRGSVTDADAVARAVDGVEMVVSSWTGFPVAAPSKVDAPGNALLIKAAASAGADVVLLSSAGAAPDSPLELFRVKHAAEEALRQAGTTGTIIRPDAFADLWIEILTDTAKKSQRPLVFGPGQNPRAWVAIRDVADLVLRIVEDPSLRGAVYTIAGPEPISISDLARRLMRARDWPGEPRHVPVAALRIGSLLPGQPGRLTGMALEMERLPLVVDDTRSRVPELACTGLDVLL